MLEFFASLLSFLLAEDCGQLRRARLKLRLSGQPEDPGEALLGEMALWTDRLTQKIYTLMGVNTCLCCVSTNSSEQKHQGKGLLKARKPEDRWTLTTMS